MLVGTLNFQNIKSFEELIHFLYIYFLCHQRKHIIEQTGYSYPSINGALHCACAEKSNKFKTLKQRVSLQPNSYSGVIQRWTGTQQSPQQAGPSRAVHLFFSQGGIICTTSYGANVRGVCEVYRDLCIFQGFIHKK